MIGPRCTLCKRQKHHHHPMTNGCPSGNVFIPFMIGSFFTPKPPRARSERVQPKAKRGGSEGRKDRKTRRAVKAEPCVACGLPPGNEINPIDVCHIRPFSVSQNDADWNCIAQCREHHRLQHTIGWFEMGMRFPGVAQALKANGWEFLANESTGDWSMFNEKEVQLNLARRSI